jgi:hypothetical protein
VQIWAHRASARVASTCWASSRHANIWCRITNEGTTEEGRGVAPGRRGSSSFSSSFSFSFSSNDVPSMTSGDGIEEEKEDDETSSPPLFDSSWFLSRPGISGPLTSSKPQVVRTCSCSWSNSSRADMEWASFDVASSVGTTTPIIIIVVPILFS